MRPDQKSRISFIGGMAVTFLFFIVSLGLIAYFDFQIDVPQGHIAVLTRRTGIDLDNDQGVAPDSQHKGLQLSVLSEGRYFYNPYDWEWSIYPMVEIPAGKMGVRVRLYGENLPYGHFVANKETQKGIVAEVLRPGRYPINAIIKGNEKSRPKANYVEIVELYDPVTIPAGFRGVVTNLAGPLPEDPNTILVPDGFRGAQAEALDAGTYYQNPYIKRVSLVDCRSQRFNLAESSEMGFASKDGFWVSLDGIIEFRVKPERAAEVLVIYNEVENDRQMDATIHEEIVRKVIMPTARSFCRLRGSNHAGRAFIGGETRTAFQKDFSDAMHQACDQVGVEIVQALITKINPPQAIAKPVRAREVARQTLNQYKEQQHQQDAEAKLAIEKALIEQKQELIGAEQTVIQQVTRAVQEQQVAVTKASEDRAVAERDLSAAKDQAAAILAKKKAEAGIFDFQNAADAAGWKTAIDALGGDGDAYARYVLYQKLAPSFQNMMINTADSPLMEIFRNFNRNRPVEKK